MSSQNQEQPILNLTAFQGPFDLLLHLIKELEVDINDIPMTEITSQYLNYIHSMPGLSLDIVGEYLVMAATLLEIKARLLLPIEPDDLEVEELPDDPRASLVQQLLIYQQFQIVADALEEKENDRAKQFNREASDLSRYQTFIPLEEDELTLDNLAQSMQEVLQRALNRQPKEKEIQYDRISVAEKMEAVRHTFAELAEEDTLMFEDLLGNTSRHELIATFMAVLELVRKQEVSFKQDLPLAPIHLKRTSKTVGET